MKTPSFGQSGFGFTYFKMQKSPAYQNKCKVPKRFKLELGNLKNSNRIMRDKIEEYKGEINTMEERLVSTEAKNMSSKINEVEYINEIHEI